MVSIVVLVGTALTPFINVITSIILSFRVGVGLHVSDNTPPESEPPESIVVAKV